MDHNFDEILEYMTPRSRKVLSSDVYHYTSAEAAILGILATRTLRMSPFKGTNDLWESRPFQPALYGGDEAGVSTAEHLSAVYSDVDSYIREYSKVACFTQDWALPSGAMEPDALRGWSHLSLWAHYGAGHTGVCLRFDRELLLAAFESARDDAIHQFHGPVTYSASEFGVDPFGIKLEQAAEFGIDAVALRFAQIHREKVYFRKHRDWSSEAEFRLVRTDWSAGAYYFNIADALTGIILGDAFPLDRLPALRKMLADFGDVEVLQAKFLARTFRTYPLPSENEATPASGLQPESQLRPVSTASIPPRRSGGLAERLRLLEQADPQSDIPLE